MLHDLRSVAAASGHRVVIHPGVVKTATSTLQRHVFARHSGLHFLGLPSPTEALDWAVQHICKADTVHLEADRLQQVFEDAFAAAPAGRTVLISYENYALYKAKDKGLVASRLQALFPGAQIVFTLRAQEELILSRYFNDLRKRIKLKAFTSFEDWYWFERRESYRTIFDDLRYHAVVEHYARLFGRENVHLILFEQLKADPEGFVVCFADLLGVDAGEFRQLMSGKRENAAMSWRYYQFWRWFGSLIPRRIVRDLATRFPGRAGSPARITLPPDIRADIAALCAEDNQRLARDFGLDLAAYGYCLPPAAAPPLTPERTKAAPALSSQGATLGPNPSR